MCCKIDKERTKRVLRTLTERGEKTTMWKIYMVEFSLPEKGCRNIRYTIKHLYRKGIDFGSFGWVKSNRKKQKLSWEEKAEWSEGIRKGIHVYTNKEAALRESDSYRKYYYNYELKPVLVPVTVYKKDFVAAGNQYDAVFMKVFLNKDDFQEQVDKIEVEVRDWYGATDSNSPPIYKKVLHFV